MEQVKPKICIISSESVEKLSHILRKFDYNIVKNYNSFEEFELNPIQSFDFLIVEKKYEGRIKNSEQSMKIEEAGLVYIVPEDNLREIVNGPGLYGSTSYILRPFNAESVIPVLESVQEYRSQLVKKLRCFKEICRNIEEGVILVDNKGKIRYVNEQAAQVTNIDISQEYNLEYSEVVKFLSEEDYKEKDPIRETLEGTKDQSGEIILKSEEYEFPVDFYAGRMDIKGGEFTGVAFVFKDLRAERRKKDIRNGLEQRLQSAQKLEIIGSITKNLTNNFNNLLTPILALSSMEIEKLTPEKDCYTTFKQIINSARLAKDLLKQLTLFSEEVEQKKSPIRIGKIVEDTFPFVEKIVKKDVTIEKEIENIDKKINADISQMHQLLVDFSTYACNKISEYGGGKLLIRLQKVDLDQVVQDSLPFQKDRDYIRFSFIYHPEKEKVTREEILNSITPLSESKYLQDVEDYISIIHNIVERHNGIFDIEENEKSTHVDIYFPVVKQQADKMRTKEKVRLNKYGSENILFIEDEDSVRKALTKVLDRLGFRVTNVNSGDKAIEKINENKGLFDLVLTDLIMPGVNGDTLAIKIKKLVNIPVIIITGYSGEISEDIKKQQAIDKIIYKPASPARIGKEINEVLRDYEQR